MQHQLHAPRFVEEALHDQRVAGGQGGQRRAGAGQVVDDLACRIVIQAKVLEQPVQRMLDGRGAIVLFAQQSVDLAAQPRHAQRQLIAAARRFAEPERDVGRGAVRILDAHFAGLDALDAVGRIAELKDVAGQALDREIFVHRADDLSGRLQHHREVGVVRDGAAGGHRRHLAAAPAAQRAADGVAVQVGAAYALAAGIAVGQHVQHRVKLRPFQAGVRRGTADQLEQLLFAPFAVTHFGDDLLRQHVQRRDGNVQDVQFTAAHAIEQCGALDQVIARRREQAALR